MLLHNQQLEIIRKFFLAESIPGNGQHVAWYYNQPDHALESFFTEYNLPLQFN